MGKGLDSGQSLRFEDLRQDHVVRVLYRTKELCVGLFLPGHVQEDVQDDELGLTGRDLGYDVGQELPGNGKGVECLYRRIVEVDNDDLGGDIEVYPLRLDFGPVGGTPRDTTVFVRNNGAGTLTVDSTWAPAGLSLSPKTFILGPGQTEPVTVSASGTGTVRDAIRYYSNDPDQRESIQYAYKNNTTFLGVGVEAPNFTLLGLDSLMHSLSDYRGRVIYLEFGACW